MTTRFMQQIAQFARSPQGRKLADEAKRLARDPRRAGGSTRRGAA
jgi:hypothetical protein